MNCPACDTAVVANARFCHACGARLAPAPNAHPLAGATETDRLPAWLKQEVESSTNPSHSAERQPAATPWPRPIPDGGLSQSMPSWLSPEASRQGGGASEENAPPPAATIPLDEQISPADDQATSIDVTTFLSAEDLPAWIRRIADPTLERDANQVHAPEPRGAEAAAPTKPTGPKPADESRATPLHDAPAERGTNVSSELASRPQQQPQPLARIGSRAARPAAASLPAERPAAASDIAAPVASDARVPPLPHPAIDTRSPRTSERATRISWHLILFVVILAAVAITGYTIYLVSFT